ncbi:MAG: hypothetical protein OXC09_13930 [Truepera sp.]|nr:hypothetical protein [Truepera sp.]
MVAIAERAPNPDSAASSVDKKASLQLLHVAPSTAYYRPNPVGEADLALIRLSDEIQLQLPCYGSRPVGDELKDRGLAVNRKRIRPLLRLAEAVHK